MSELQEKLREIHKAREILNKMESQLYARMQEDVVAPTCDDIVAFAPEAAINPEATDGVLGLFLSDIGDAMEITLPHASGQFVGRVDEC